MSTSTALRILDFSMSLHVLTYSTPNRQVFGIIPSHPRPLPPPTSELFLTKTCYHFSIFLLASQNPMGLSRSASMTPSPTIQLLFASPPPWPQALSYRVYGRGLSPHEKKIATQALTAIELRVLAQKRFRCTQGIWSAWGQGGWEWLELRRKRVLETNTFGQCQRRKRSWHRDGPDKRRLGEQVPQWPELQGDGD